MKYFLPELYARFQSLNDEEANAADSDWERAAASYQQQLKGIWGALPQSARELVDRYYLHDAEVLTIARSGQSLTITVRLDPAPHDCLMLQYTLDGEPRIERGLLPAQAISTPVQWMYDELDVAADGHTFSHEILLSNGWCLSLRFATVQIFPAAVLLPGEPMQAPGGSSAVLAQTV